VGDGLCLLNSGEEEELGDTQSTGAQCVVIELGDEAGGAAAVEAKAVADLERVCHPG
jgi:hypothetical protein